MATKVLDRDKVVELVKKYRPIVNFVKTGGGTLALQFLCPFHADTNPSFTFNHATDKGRCFACQKNADLLDVIAAFEQTSRNDVTKLIVDCYRKVTPVASARKVSTIDISQAQLNEWAKALDTDLKLQPLFTRWGWNKDLLARFTLGSSEGRLVIPFFEGTDLIGLKYYNPGSTTVKYQNSPGTNACCWPLENLDNDVLYLVEGEKDCLTMIAAGFNAATFTTGAGSVAKDYIRYFAGKTVYIIYDIDEAGRNGAVTVANTLNFATKKIHIVDLPLDGIPKGDLTDAYMQDPENFVAFIENIVLNTEEYKAPAAVNRVHVPSTVHRTYLEDIVQDKLFYKRVNLKARVISNVHNETTIVPKDIRLTCNRDFKNQLCQQCPSYYAEEGLSLHIRPDYPEIMSMVGNNNKIQRAAIQSMLEVIEGCTKFKVEQKTHQALYPIVIIPAIEANKKKHNYTMVEAWALDVPAKENEDYDVEGVVMADPETQKLVLLCYRLQEDATSIDSFELTPEMIKQLEVFQCTNRPSPVLIAN